MTRDEIDRILERHFAALQKRDLDGILATYTDDAEHDAVGRDPNPIRGKAALGAFYRDSLADLESTKVIPVRRLYGEAFAIDESILDGYAQGRPFDLEGYSRPVRFRMLRVFEFRDGLIARENVWFDIVAVQRQLSTPRH
ncbi:MAG: nuclear transport factor 2 family protein [Chloroflexota bacterium]